MVKIHAGVIGHPISHSLSPKLHRRWIKAMGIEGDYTAIDGENEEVFRHLVATLPQQGYAGLNVTLPFKRDAYDIADERTERAKAIGAVNLLIFKDGKLIGDNTDSEGFAAAVASLGLDEKPNHARILGAGGASPAIIMALKDMGVERIEIANRTLSKANEMADRFEIHSIPWPARDAGLEKIDLLINTTSLGMAGQPPLDMHIGGLPDHAAVIDIITTPAETELLRGARERGLKTTNGLPMLVYQAIPSFEAWFHVRPDDAPEAIAYLAEET